MTGYRILMIDDDSTKLTQLLARAHLATNLSGSDSCEDAQGLFVPEEMQIKNDTGLEEVVKRILEVDSAVIDYKLGADANVNFTGIEVARNVMLRHNNYPLFILTSHVDDVYQKEIIDVCHVFAFEDYLSSDEYAANLNLKILKQIENHKREVSCWEEEFLRLQHKSNLSLEENERLIELDTWLEQISGGSLPALPKGIKKDLNYSKFDEIIVRLDMLLKGQN